MHALIGYGRATSPHALPGARRRVPARPGLRASRRRAREARALAWLGWQGVSPAGKGRTRIEIGNVTVLWTDATAAWAIEGKPHVKGVGIVALWMLARDVSGLTAEAEIEDATSQ